MKDRLKIQTLLALSICFLWIFVASPTQVLGLEKLRFGTGFKRAPDYNLPMWAAEEQGFWKKRGLTIEWVQVNGTGVLFRAAAAGAVDMGVGVSYPGLISLVRGVPALVVADYEGAAVFHVYVPPDSAIRKPEDIRDARIGVSTLSGAGYAAGIFLTKQLGFEGQAKFFSFGAGASGQLAALKSRKADAIILAASAVARLLAEGKLRSVVSMRDYLPKPWTEHVVFATRAIVKNKPDIVRKGVDSFFEGISYAQNNREWQIDILKSRARLSSRAAAIIADSIFPKRGKKIDPKALKNVMNFLVEYKLVKAKPLPKLETLYTTQFAQ